METSYNYKGYNITYSSTTGTTKVEEFGTGSYPVYFLNKGKLNGDKLAKEYIDKI